jgi:hypothetical protein
MGNGPTALLALIALPPLSWSLSAVAAVAAAAALSWPWSSFIQTPHAERLDLPASAVASGILRVAMRPGGALPVNVTVPIPPAPGPDLMLEGLRDHALLSP